MKKQVLKLSFLMILGSLILSTSSCKKGEDDPAISLRSRTARLAGEWTLSSADITVKSVNDNNTITYHYVFDGSIMTETDTWNIGGSTGTDQSTYSYSDKLTIEKDGTFKDEMMQDKTKETYEGNWMWLMGNEKQGIKDKQAFMMVTTKYTEVDENGNTSYYNNSGKSIPCNISDDYNEAMVNVLNRLANDEMVIVLDFKSTDDDGAIVTVTGTSTYKQD